MTNWLSRITAERSGRERSLRRILLIAGVVFVAFLVLSVVGYRVVEPTYGWLDAVYMTIITVATVGFNEVRPLGAGGRLWTIFVIIGGVITGAVVMSLVVATLVEGSIRGIFGRRHLEKQIAALSDHIMLCGYGRTGQRIAIELKQAGRPVVAVDIDPERTALAEADGVLYVRGDALEEATLRAAGIDRASALIATLPDDAGNVFLTLSARGFNSSVRIIARANEAPTQSTLERAGATRVICPLIIGANRVVDVLLRPAMVDFVEMAHKGVDLEMDQMTLRDDSSVVGQTLRQLGLPSRAGAMVVAVRRPDGTAIYNPGPDIALAAGDTIILIGKRGVAATLARLPGTAPEATPQQ